MAIVPKFKYPSQTLTTDAGYPFGKARNVQTAGDGSGTPWEADLVNDLFGFLQSLLSAGHLSTTDVTGNPDKVGASDYLNALRRADYAWIGAHAFQAAVSLAQDPTYAPAVTEWRNLNILTTQLGASTARNIGGHPSFQGTSGGVGIAQVPILLPTGTTFDALRIGYQPTADADTTITVYKQVANTTTGGAARTKLNATAITVAASAAQSPVAVPIDAPETVSNAGAYYYVEINCGAQSTASFASLNYAQVHATYNVLSVR